MAALRFHNLIPDVINFKTFFGTKNAKISSNNIHFEIQKVDPELISFGIKEVTVDDQTIRVAEPVRAILDTFLGLKISPQNRNQIGAYLRIEDEDMEKINWSKAPLYAKKIKSDLAKSIATAMTIRTDES